MFIFNYTYNDCKPDVKKLIIPLRIHLKRLNRKTIGFSKSGTRHKAVIQLYMYHEMNQQHF